MFKPNPATGRQDTAEHRLILILIGMSAVYFFAYFQRVAVPGTIFTELQTEFHTSAGTVAWLAAVYLYLTK